MNQCEEQPYAYEALDNRSNPPIIYETRDTLSSDDCGNYVHLVTLTAYDVCGNTSDTSSPSPWTIRLHRCSIRRFRPMLL